MDFRVTACADINPLSTFTCVPPTASPKSTTKDDYTAPIGPSELTTKSFVFFSLLTEHNSSVQSQRDELSSVKFELVIDEVFM